MEQADMLPQRHVLAPQLTTTVEVPNIPVKSGQQQSSQQSSLSPLRIQPQKPLSGGHMNVE
jgi:hypothetical protein